MALILFCVFSLQGCKRTGFEIGNKFPNLGLFDMKRNPVKIYDYHEEEKLLLFQIWGAACCPVFSAPTLKAVSAINSDKSINGITVVSVNLDNPTSEVLRISKELQLSQLMLRDKMSNYYSQQQELQFYFPLSIIFLVDQHQIIRDKLKGHQSEPAIRDMIIQFQNDKNRPAP